MVRIKASAYDSLHKNLLNISECDIHIITMLIIGIIINV